MSALNRLFETLVVIVEYSIVVIIAMEMVAPGAAGVSTGPRSTTSAPILQWSVDTFPNPQDNYDGCGLLNVPSWICDPSLQLTSEQVSDVSEMLNDIYSQSKFDCSDDTSSEVTGGYITSVVIVTSLESFQGSGWYNGSTLSVIGEEIATVIRKDIWQFGQCGEDLLILIFIQGSQIYVSMGDSISKQLGFNGTEDYFSKFQTIVSHDMIYDALVLQISDIQTLLGVETTDTAGVITVATDDRGDRHVIIKRPVKRPELTTPVLVSIIFISVSGGLTCLICIYISNRRGYFTLPRRFRGLGWGPGWGMGWGMAMQNDHQQHHHHQHHHQHHQQHQQHQQQHHQQHQQHHQQHQQQHHQQPNHVGSLPHEPSSLPHEPSSKILIHHRYSQTAI